MGEAGAVEVVGELVGERPVAARFVAPRAQVDLVDRDRRVVGVAGVRGWPSTRRRPSRCRATRPPTPWRAAPRPRAPSDRPCRPPRPPRRPRGTCSGRPCLDAGECGPTRCRRRMAPSSPEAASSQPLKSPITDDGPRAAGAHTRKVQAARVEVGAEKVGQPVVGALGETPQSRRCPDRDSPDRSPAVSSCRHGNGPSCRTCSKPQPVRRS